MADPIFQKAEDVATEIASRMKAITVANDCETDIGTTVYEGRMKVDDDMLPCISIVEGPDHVQAQDGARRVARASVRQEYVVFAYLACDPDRPNVAGHAALRDIKRALFRTDGEEDASFGGRVIKVHYLGRDMGARADGASSVAVSLHFAVEFVEALANP